MTLLFIDAGNTTIDCRYYQLQTNKFLPVLRLPTVAFLQLTKKDFLSKINWPETSTLTLVYSSVVPLFERWLGQTWTGTTFNIRDSALIRPQDFAFDWHRLGSDLITTFYAQRNWGDLLIINLGTATTLSLIQDHCFQGTIIAPGISLSLKALIDHAALLKAQPFTWSKQEIGRTTFDSISLGAINGHYQMIKSWLIKWTTPTTKVIFTGGNAEMIFPALINDGYVYQEDLIFQGLLKLYLGKRKEK